MNTMLVSEFKARCAEALARVEQTGEPLLVTRRGKPVAKIVSATTPARPRVRLGRAHGKALIKDDLARLDLSADWEMNQ